MMAVGCSSLSILLFIFIYIIFTHFQSPSITSISKQIEGKEKVKEHLDANEMKANKHDDKDEKREKKETTFSGIREFENEKRKENEINVGMYKIMNLFTTVRRSLYLTTVLFISLFHAVSSFSNSFIVEVSFIKESCVYIRV